MTKLIIKTQGGSSNTRGWRYSPREGQEDLVKYVAEKLHTWVADDHPSAVWWKIFSKDDENRFIERVAALGAIVPEIDYQDVSPVIEEEDGGDLEELLDKAVDNHTLLSTIAADIYKIEKLEVIGENNNYMLVKCPLIQSKNLAVKVVKICKRSLSQSVVFDGATDGRLGKNKLQSLIQQELV